MKSAADGAATLSAAKGRPAGDPRTVQKEIINHVTGNIKTGRI